MEREISNLIMLWIIVIACLTYCYFISSRIPKGTIRLLSLLHVIVIFILAPLTLSSLLLQLCHGCFISWFATFKLLLFAFGKDDALSINPSISLPHFIILTTLPIKQKPAVQTLENKEPSSMIINLAFATNLLIWLSSIQMYVYYTTTTWNTNSIIIHSLYAIRITFGVQIYYDLVAAIAKLVLRQELEKQFNYPHMSTSLQNFWGRRWNLVSSTLLKGTIYEPTRSLLTLIMGKRLALHSAILVTYFVSGLAHEMIYFYVGRQWPTWEATLFFIIHGVCLSIEIEVKKMALKRGWKLHSTMSSLLTVVFIIVTGLWLCYSQLIHCKADEREIQEYIFLSEYLKHKLAMFIRTN